MARDLIFVLMCVYALLVKLFIGEGNGNPLQCSWLENPRDGGTLWAAIYGVAQSRTRLKRCSSSSSSSEVIHWRRKWQPTPVFLAGESQGWGNFVGCHLWGHTESDMTEVTYSSSSNSEVIQVFICLFSHSHSFVNCLYIYIHFAHTSIRFFVFLLIYSNIKLQILKSYLINWAETKYTIYVSCI